jgi:hypothetical protein
LDCSSITTITSMFFTLDKGRLVGYISEMTLPPQHHHHHLIPLGCLPIHLRVGLVLHVHLEISNVMTKVFRVGVSCYKYVSSSCKHAVVSIWRFLPLFI